MTHIDQHNLHIFLLIGVYDYLLIKKTNMILKQL
jgi:hypothetical protein